MAEDTSLVQQHDAKPRQGERWLPAALTVLLVLSSLYVFAMWIIDTRPLMNLNSYEKAKFVDMVYGKAHKPFVYRVLVPTIVRLVRSAIPDSLNYETHGRVYAQFPDLYEGMLYLGWELEYLTEYATAAVFMYASLLGYAYALRSLAKTLYSMDKWLEGVLPILAIWILPIFFVKGTHYLYDFPQLLLFTLLLVNLAKKRWWAFYPLLVVGLLNKETAIFVSIIFAACCYKVMSRKAFIGHLALQGAIFAAIKVYLGVRFAANPGGIVENHLFINLYNALLRPFDLATACSVIALFLLIAYRFRQKPLFLRQSLLIAVPMVLLYASLGTYGEIRVFYELVPIAFLLAFQTLSHLLGWNFDPRQPILAQETGQ